MRSAEPLPRVYEELADRFGRQNEPRHRDHCLVLAADASLSAGHAVEAERLRQRLLHVNPHHLVRPFASMAEAMQAADVQEYVADLRRQWPADLAQRLYASGERVTAPTETPTPVATPVATPAPRPEPRVVPLEPVRKAAPLPTARPAPVTPAPRAAAVAEEPANPAGPWLATMLMLLAVAGGVGLFFVTFVWPLLE